MREYQIQAFPKETLESIAEQFHEYFVRKKRNRLSYREAKMLIDNISGPAPGPIGADTAGYAGVHVSGGGAVRPTDEQVDAMLKRHERDHEPNEWDDVFDELLRRSERNSEVEKLIFMTYRDRCSWYVICGDLFMSKTRYYEALKGILEQAGVIALKKDVLKHWKC